MVDFFLWGLAWQIVWSLGSITKYTPLAICQSTARIHETTKTNMKLLLSVIEKWRPRVQRTKKSFVKPCSHNTIWATAHFWRASIQKSVFFGRTHDAIRSLFSGKVIAIIRLAFSILETPTLEYSKQYRHWLQTVYDRVLSRTKRIDYGEHYGHRTSASSLHIHLVKLKWMRFTYIIVYLWDRDDTRLCVRMH